MDHGYALERIYDHIENDQVENAVMGCLRVARHLKDYVYAAYFMRELYPDGKEVNQMICEDSASLKSEAKKYISKKSLERWLEVHSLDFNFPLSGMEDDGTERNVLQIAAGEIDADVDRCERSIADMTAPNDPRFPDESMLEQKALFRLRIKATQTIRSRLKARCHSYAIQIERQLASQGKSQAFLENVQNDVNNFFKARSDDIYQKLHKAAELSGSEDLEDASLLLTEVRRALKAVADHLYPPVSEPVQCSDGRKRALGDEQYMNRLQEFIMLNLARSGARDLLKVELDHFSSFIRRLNDISSKGVHASVTLAESKQGLVGLYFFLFNFPSSGLSLRLRDEPL